MVSPQTCEAVIPVVKLKKFVIPVFKLCLGLIFVQTGMDSGLRAEKRLACFKKILAGVIDKIIQIHEYL
jgi:hypothetical protein